MYDLSTMFHSFYKEEVVLPKAEKNKLFNKKDLNLQRLKDGLVEYNSENNTNYKLAEHMVQGSVAMSTIIQNEKNEYDIDVAIVFDKDKIPDNTNSVKQFVVDALLKKCTSFKVAPHKKTNCVRIVYTDGYHIDFAIYRRFKDENDQYKYEHCGSEWRSRDPKAITDWFIEENKDKDYKLREVVRLMKMFSTSRSEWKMPGGLVQSVLANEQYNSTYNRIDERLYHTLIAIKNRLGGNLEVLNPTDPTQTLKLIKKDNEKINNLYNRLKKYLEKLDILFDSDCTKAQAIAAWKEFFNHSFWNETVVLERSFSSFEKQWSQNDDDLDYLETEEFIEYKFPMDLKYWAELDCTVTQNGWRVKPLFEMIREFTKLLPQKKLDFLVRTNTPAPYEIYWKVKNKGLIAKRKNQIRGQIVKGSARHTEHTMFKGEHFVEVYIIKNKTCVAKNKVDIPIKEF